jgi:hypothetical protein
MPKADICDCDLMIDEEYEPAFKAGSTAVTPVITSPPRSSRCAITAPQLGQLTTSAGVGSAHQGHVSGDAAVGACGSSDLNGLFHQSLTALSSCE